MDEENNKEENSSEPTKHFNKIWKDHHNPDKRAEVKNKRVREERKKSKIDDFGL